MVSEKIKMTPIQKAAQEEANNLYSMYNQDGVTPLNFIPSGVQFYTDEYEVNVTVTTRKRRK